MIIHPKQKRVSHIDIQENKRQNLFSSFMRRKNTTINNTNGKQNACIKQLTHNL